MIAKIAKVWTWFSGKKTAIGAAAMLLSAVVTEVVLGIWSVEWAPLELINETLLWAGRAFAVGGLMHKGVKAKTPGEVGK